MSKKKTTIQDIANAVGLSKSTVSRALKDHPDITDRTKRMINEAVSQHGYQPNVFAQNFNKNRSNIIGIVVPDIERPYYASIISGAQERATQQKFFIVICQSKDSLITEINNLQTMVGLGVDGIIVCHSKETSHFNEIRKIVNKGMPVLAIERELGDVPTHFISNDHFVAGFMIGEHLTGVGYKHVAIIGGPENLQMSQQRIQGCIDGCKANGVTVRTSDIYYCHFQRERELAAVTNLLEKTERPDAIFCVYDRGAAEIMQFLQKKHIAVPEEIGVAGSGNDPISQYLSPRMTTINQGPHKLGELAAEVLINEITSGNGSVLTRQVIRPTLLARESTMRPVGI